jgi:ABC-type transport system involved in multi-copper enzyme maturation permease subunit
MFWNLLANENTKNMRRSMLWIELGLLVIFILLIHVLLFSVLQLNLGGEAATAGSQAQLSDSLTWPGALTNVLNFVGGNVLGGLLLITFVGAVTAQEYSWRTLHLWLSRGTPRPGLLAAKFTALLLPILLVVLVALLSGALVSGVFTVLLEGGLPLDQINIAHLALSLLRTAYTLLPYAALTFLLAIATRSSVVAIGGGLAYSLLGEGLILQMLGLLGGGVSKILAYLPAGLANSLMNLNMPAAQVQAQGGGLGMQVELLPPGPAAIGIAAWTLSFFGLALWIFRRQDISN